MTGFYITISSQNYRLFCAESDYAKGVNTTPQGISMNLNYGVGGSLRLSTSPTGKEGDWTYFSLLGKTISWEIDLSNVPCGLNSTFYSVYLKDGQSYKDACATYPSTTELDFMEANKYSWHTTLHRANNDCGSAPPIGFGGTINNSKYQFYDVSGQQKNVNLLYGPGTQYLINTLENFTASIEFSTTNNILDSVNIILEQSGNKIGQSYNSNNEEYKGWLEALGKEMVVTETSGNVLVWSIWTGGLNWLESPPCGYNSKPKCDSNSCQYTISNINLQ
jgi:hypothetical protein